MLEFFLRILSELIHPTICAQILLSCTNFSTFVEFFESPNCYCKVALEFDDSSMTLVGINLQWSLKLLVSLMYGWVLLPFD